MKRRLILLIFPVVWCVFIHAAEANRSGALSLRGSDSGCSNVKFHSLSRYKGASWSKVFTDREVVPILKTILKKDYQKLIDSLQEATYPEDSLSYVDDKGVLSLEGGVPGLYTIMEAKLIVEPCGSIYSAVLDNGERFLYFSNDPNFTEKLPATIERWISKIETARSEPEAKPKLPVVFKSKASLP